MLRSAEAEPTLTDAPKRFTSMPSTPAAVLAAIAAPPIRSSTAMPPVESLAVVAVAARLIRLLRLPFAIEPAVAFAAIAIELNNVPAAEAFALALPLMLSGAAVLRLPVAVVAPKALPDNLAPIPRADDADA